MKTNKKVIQLIVIFLLLVPFRLPIGVLFIQAVSFIASSAAQLSNSVLVANVIITKLIYDITLSVISIWNIERVSRNVKGRMVVEGTYATPAPMYWWTALFIVFFAIYIIFDCVNTWYLYYELKFPNAIN